jgi:ATP phosphoribosyltransferase
MQLFEQVETMKPQVATSEKEVRSCGGCVVMWSVVEGGSLTDTMLHANKSHLPAVHAHTHCHMACCLLQMNSRANSAVHAVSTSSLMAQYIKVQTG